MQEIDPAAAPLLSEARERSLNEDLQQLAQDARAYAEAEFQFQKSRAAYTANSAKSIAVLGIAALVVLFFAAIALVVGLVIALAPLLTAWGSTALVTLGLLGLAGFLLLRAKKRYDRMMAVVGEEKAA
ncbi:phage holin family protein [Novosphingobium sp. M1R2S20]|uniref:Phage holin family protein n=1 Tax=Novosphingobium rhizovicinum TaxID=3228928 RepID=A0ABV3R7Z2_9SPHN